MFGIINKLELIKEIPVKKVTDFVDRITGKEITFCFTFRNNYFHYRKMKKSSVPYTSHFFNVKKRIATEAQIQSSWSEIFSKIAPKAKDEGPKVDKSIKSK